MAFVVNQPTFPRSDPRTIADDGDELHFCSTCAFSQACLSQDQIGPHHGPHPLMSTVMNSIVFDVTQSPTRTAPVAELVDSRALGTRLLTLSLEQLRAADAYLSGTGEDEHVGIHQARKCIRRTRAALALAGRKLGQRAERLDDELARLCRSMAGLRDAQALVDELRRLRASPTSVKVGALLSKAESAALQRRDDMLTQALARDPGFASRRKRLLTAQSRLERLDWQAVSEEDVLHAVERSKRRADKSQRRAKRHPDDDRLWHVYRRRLRRLRQQDSLLAELQPNLRISLGSLDDHTALGESQDDALLLRRCGKGSPFPAGEQRTVLRKIARERLQRARGGRR
jgi:hypothetical protein